MEQSEISRNFQVALLMEDVEDAKLISDGFREVGIFAHFYQELDELWVSLSSDTPDLCIVDVKKMSQGTLLFKQHQKVKNHSLKYAFYYKDSTQVLLNATFGLDHYGLIRGELDLVDQLKSVLLRRNEELRLIEENDKLSGRINRLKLRSVRLTEQQEKDHFSLWQSNHIFDLAQSFGKVSSFSEFNKRLIYIFSQWDDCLDFGVYQLNATKQKLVSPKARKTSYKNLPDLWLSSPAQEGIDDYAIQMAYDVCYGLMDTELLILKINGSHDNPDVLVIGNFNKEKTLNIKWDILETKLSSEYRKLLMGTFQKSENKTHQDSIFKTFQVLDDIQFHDTESKHRYALVDFSALVSMVKQNHAERFYWDSFAKEFISELSEILSGDFRFTSYGVQNFLVAIDKKYIETDFHKLKEFAADFQFWRHFEDSSLVMSPELAPDVRFVAPSSVNVLRQSQDGASDFMQRPIRSQTRQLDV